MLTQKDEMAKIGAFLCYHLRVGKVDADYLLDALNFGGLWESMRSVKGALGQRIHFSWVVKDNPYFSVWTADTLRSSTRV